MPTQSTISSADKSCIKSILPNSTYKIITATLARIYYAHPSPNKWSYTGLQGGLVFVRDTKTGAHWFKLCDLQGTRGVLWDCEMPLEEEYAKDRGFFHSFAGDDCMIGFVFADQSEADTLHKKVNTRSKSSKKSAKPAKSKTSSSGGSKIDKSRISAPDPTSFTHVAHMGYDADRGFTSTGVDASWKALLDNVRKQGISEDVIRENESYIRQFVKERQVSAGANANDKKKKPPPPPAPRRSVLHAPSDSASSLAEVTSGSPSPQTRPPPPSRPVGRVPPPPVRPSSEALTPPQPPARSVSTSPAPPPPPPARPAAPPQAPPPPPTRSGPPPPPPPPQRPGGPPPPPPPPPPSSSSGGPPPPPPPPPPTAGAPPPPPPPPPPTAGAPPPPPPPPPPGAPAAGIPAPQPGRADLLASIQGKGVHSLRKVDTSSTPSSAPSPAPVEESSGSGGGGDLASALAAALSQRSKKLGDSDEEDDEEDWD